VLGGGYRGAGPGASCGRAMSLCDVDWHPDDGLTFAKRAITHSSSHVEVFNNSIS